MIKAIVTLQTVTMRDPDNCFSVHVHLSFSAMVLFGPSAKHKSVLHKSTRCLQKSTVVSKFMLIVFLVWTHIEKHG